MTHITALPTEVLSMIHGHATKENTDITHAEGMPPARLYPRLSRDQASRKEAMARKNWLLVSKQFHFVDRFSLGGKHNGDRGCLVAKEGIASMARSSGHTFENDVRTVLWRHDNIEVDFSSLTPEQARIVLRLLSERADDSAADPLCHVRFKVHLDRSPPDLVEEINATIGAMRASRNGDEAEFRFGCCSNDKSRRSIDLTSYTELTSVDLSSCWSMDTVPDFSRNKRLTSVILYRCADLKTTPDFSMNGMLQSVDLSYCESMQEAPDFTNNPRLTSVHLSHCFVMRTAPDFSRNAELTSVNLSGCMNIVKVPDFSANPKLIQVNLSRCESMKGSLDFSQNVDLESVNLSFNRNLRRAPDFSHNPKLTSVNLSWCVELREAPKFLTNLKLKLVDLSQCPKLEGSVEFSPDMDMTQVTVMR